MTTPSPRTSSRNEALPATNFNRDRELERSDRPARLERAERNDRYDRPERFDRGDRNERDRGDRPEREDREWRNNAEAVSMAPEGPARVPNGSMPSPAPASSSLRERIGGGPGGPPMAQTHPRGNFSGREDFGDGRKRTMTERDRDALLDAPLSGANDSRSTNAPKRQRVQINRNRYQYQEEGNSGALARKALNNLPK